mmetsp:Transcript_52430/g.162777  ORF Transcript_52430/g.162777 Transcript_52430/m.162777 type:complete len:259 (+) Transcript_52430:484-1260(+)
MQRAPVLQRYGPELPELPVPGLPVVERAPPLLCCRGFAAAARHWELAPRVVPGPHQQGRAPWSRLRHILRAEGHLLRPPRDVLQLLGEPVLPCCLGAFIHHEDEDHAGTQRLLAGAAAGELLKEGRDAAERHLDQVHAPLRPPLAGAGATGLLAAERVLMAERILAADRTLAAEAELAAAPPEAPSLAEAGVHLLPRGPCTRPRKILPGLTARQRLEDTDLAHARDPQEVFHGGRQVALVQLQLRGGLLRRGCRETLN